MKILHVASFSGNVGDNANHNGLRRMLASVIDTPIEYKEIEMRRFYRNYDGQNKMRFDLDFASFANTFDLLIIGGGNFFEVWIEDSQTGCTVDIGRDVLNALKTKTFFFGLGFDTYKGCSDVTLKRFLEFVSAVQDSERFLVTVRNDGSRDQFIESYGMENAHLVRKVPDGGFFVEPDPRFLPVMPVDRMNVVISLAQDMPSVRFGKANEELGHRLLVDTFVDYVTTLHEKVPEAYFTFMPHIYSDIKIIHDVIDRIPDNIRRNDVAVGPNVVGKGAEHPVFCNYRAADMVIAMRFHANVCPIGFSIPTIGISTYRKIYDLYNDLNILERVLQFEGKNMHEKLLEKTFFLISNRADIRRQNESIMNGLYKDMNILMKDVAELVTGT